MRKKQKRILIIALIILIFGIVATLITIPLVKNNNEKRMLKDKLENLEIPYTGENDISLPIMLDEYVITWESSHPDILSELGKIINYPNSDTTVKLKATINGSRTKVERIFYFLIKAKTKSEQKLLILFDPNGGILESLTSKNLLIEKGKLISKPKDPVREGYKFIGWYLGMDKFNFGNEIKKNLKLVAKWEKLKYELTLPIDVTAKVDTKNISFNKFVEHDSEVLLTIINEDVLSGKAIPILKINGIQVNLTGNTYLIEKFNQNTIVTLDIIPNKVTYKFNLNGGTAKGIDENINHVSKGTILELPETPIKEGYDFIGWNVEFPYVVNGDVEIIANYKIKEYKITYNNFIIKGLNSNSLADYGSTITIKAINPEKLVEIIIFDSNYNVLKIFKSTDHNFFEAISYLVEQNIIIIGKYKT